MKNNNSIFYKISKVILTVITLLPILVLSITSIVDQTNLKNYGINGALANEQIIPDGKTFTLRAKNNLVLSFPGFLTSTSSFIISLAKNSNPSSQLLTWVNDKDNYGYLFIY